ncbi:MAG TPA: hypothetical protein PKI86_07925, partial [Chitinophagales bacterium]|nr:hypothetical protein [Chitinophagales bacterium]
MPRIIADNAGSEDAVANGKFSFISNVKYEFAVANLPLFSTPHLSVGFNRYDDLLQALNSYAQSATPLIPTLQGGPAPFGWCEANYWNRNEVESQQPTAAAGALCYWHIPSVFEGFYQLIIKNTSFVETKGVVEVAVDGRAPAVLSGAAGTAGILAPQGVWTTVLPEDRSVQVLLNGEVVAGEVP